MTHEIQEKRSRQELKNLYLFAMGKGVSLLGTSIYSFAISLQVLKTTGSALNFATMLLLSSLPMILIGPLAGVLADRLPKKTLVVGMDLGSGMLFTLLFFYARSRPLTLPVIYATTILLNLFTTIFGIGMEAAKPSLVTRNRLIRLNALSKLIDSTAMILGPFAGGMVFALMDTKTFILFNAVSFVFSAFTEGFMDFHLNQTEKQAPGRTGLVSDLREGWLYFSRNSLIQELFRVFVSLNFLIGFSVNVPEPYIINQILKLSPASYGIINGIFPLGLIMGTLTVEKVMKRFEFRRLLMTLHAFMALLAGCVGLPALMNPGPAPALVFYALLNLLIGITIAWVDVPIMTILQREIPAWLLGRVLSLMMGLIKVVLPLALLASGLLINLLPVVVVPLLGGGAAFGYSLFLLRRIKRSAHD